MAVILLKTPDGGTREYAVDQQVLIGRGSHCQIRIDDDRVSRRHAEVRREGDEFHVQDLESKNGTFVNKRRVTNARLAYGDEIVVGRLRLLFSDHAPSDLVGSVIGGYRVLEEIGSGGMGVVYRGSQARLNRIVAIKVLHPRLVADRKFVERFLREGQAAGSLNHINVVHVYEAGRTDDTYYYVMEYVDGPTVAEELRRHGPFVPDHAIAIAAGVASALAYAHKQGIIHRDVKPENIMLAPDGVAKLADLGLARTIEARTSDVERGPDGRARIWGTPAYIAPEVALGHEADERSDLYSLGATLFHMLTGRAPFVGDTVTEVLTQHVRAPLPPIETLAPDVPRALNSLLEKLMAKSAERRHQTGDELLAELAVVREAIRQAASAEETRYATPVHPAEPARGGRRTSFLRRLSRWLGHPSE